MEETRNKRKIVLTVVLVLALIAAAIAGTYAWLIAQDSAQNTFTVGEFNEPSVKPDPDNPDQPGSDSSIDGFLTETKWVNFSKVYQGAKIAKNPNVGIGAGSDDAYVFVYVENNTQTSHGDIATNAPYFFLNKGWEEVEADSITVGENRTAYTGGLFVYKGGAGPYSNIFKASESDDDYTGEVFSQVIVPEGADLDKYAENPTMDVFAYLYSVQYTDAGQSTPATSGEGSYAAAEEAAKLWDDTCTIS